jgi:hypothetical protein
MTEYYLEHIEFDKSANKRKWSIILADMIPEHSYITFHERKEGRITGRTILCQVRSCVDVYTAGLRIGEYYAEGQVPMRPPMFWLVEYVPMLTDKRTVLDLKSKLESAEDLEAAQKYIFGA